jgi:CubicO group peptidase (beta-lactamase class C family)
MITRRGVLRVAVQGLAVGFGSAMAQQPKRKGGTRKKASNNPAPVRADERLNDILAPIRDEHHLPGLIGAILSGDGLEAIGAVGIRKIGSPEPMQITDRVHLGSCTKTMTATLAGLLIDEGKLKWGSTIAEIFPDAADQVHPGYRRVTLAQLLTHRAGLPHNIDRKQLDGRTPTEQRTSILTTMLKNPPRHKPGSAYEYSNVGYTLAGLMTEKVTDQSWNDLMKRRIFDPLAMATAGFGSPGQRGTVEQPWGHRELKGEIQPAQLGTAPPVDPAGAVHCSLPDWSRFAALHLAAARGRPRLLKAATFRALHTPPPGFEYAGGWFVCQRTWAGGRALTHGGTNTSFFVTVWLAPALNLGFLAAANQGGQVAEKAVDQAIAALIKASELPAEPIMPGS